MKSKQLFFENLVAAAKVGGIPQGYQLNDKNLYEVVEKLLSESAVGPKGDKGDQGDTGPAGPTGPGGPTGPTGPSGTVTIEGLVYRGVWSTLVPATLFEYGDVVSYNGASYVRILPGFDTISEFPNTNSDWVLLAAQGASGPTGSQGPVGETGPQGPVGLTGPQGAQGLQGTQGQNGIQGPIGLTGPAGATGLQGVKGDKGDTGNTGAVGSTGPQGVKGDAGPVGPAGLTWRSSWVANTSYLKDDAVGYDGASWFCLLNHSGISVPPNLDPTRWALLASQGAIGPQGPTGATGATGSTGPQGIAGADGPQGVAGVKGDTGAQGLVGPAGPQGIQGPQGPQGGQGAAGVLLVTVTANASPVSIAPNATATIVVDDGTKVLLGSNIYIDGIGYFYVATKSGNNIGVTNLYSASTLVVGSFQVVIVTGPPGLQGPTGATGATGNTGATGSAGIGITSIVFTSSTGGLTSGISGATDTYTINYTQGSPSTFNVYNGIDGGGGLDYYVTSGTADTYTVAAITTYTGGDAYTIKFNAANTGASTLNGKTLVDTKTQTDLVAGDIILNQNHLIVYDSTIGKFQVLTIGGGGGSGDMLKSTYDVDDDGIVDSSEKEMFLAKNGYGTTLTKGTIVYLKSSSSSSSHPEVLKANANTEATSSKTIGAVYEDIAAGEIGYIVTSGRVHNLNTNSYNIGDKLWLATTDGGVTTTVPAKPNHSVFIGTVTRSNNNNGGILYAIQNGYEIEELHDVSITTPATGEYLYYDATTDPSNPLWKNSADWQGNTIAVPKLPLMVGATSLADGVSGLVPTPLIADRNLFLRGDAAWATLVASGTIASGEARRLALYPSGGTGLDDTLDAGNTRIVIAAHATGRQYTIDNVGANASFIMTEGAQNIVGTKSFTGSAGPLQFTQTGAGTFTAPTTGATPSAGTRIVIAPGAVGQTPLSLGWSLSYEFWIAGRHFISFYPRNQTSSVGAFEYVATTAGTTGLTLTTAYNVAPALRTLSWLHVAGATTGAVPTLTSARSVGTKIVLRDAFLASTYLDAAIGTVDEQVGSSFATLWFTAPRDITFYTNSGTTERFRINSTGLSYNATKILGSRITGWGTPGGTLTRATIAADAALATPTQAEFNALAQNVRALITDLRTHGLIGT
jgi:hypothetical protein